jgi:hypothetical protein
MTSLISERIEPTGLRIRHWDREGFIPIGAQSTFYAADYVDGSPFLCGTGDTEEAALFQLTHKLQWKDAA